MDYILQKLNENRDEKYRLFQAKLMPTVNPDTIIGVRTPELRAMAKEVSKDERCLQFLEELPHQYSDENQLHASIISDIKDFDKWVQNCTIQNARDSRRITVEQKEYLKTLKI